MRNVIVISNSASVLNAVMQAKANIDYCLKITSCGDQKRRNSKGTQKSVNKIAVIQEYLEIFKLSIPL